TGKPRHVKRHGERQMSDFSWDDYKQTGDWPRYDSPGDKVVGVIKSLRTGRVFNGNPCPQLILEQDDGSEITVTAGQVMLKAALAEKAPEVGDKIRIVYTGDSEARPGKAPAKLFTVDVQPAPHELVQAA